MILTEQKAKTKWCPHVRSIWSGDAAGNADTPSLGASNEQQKKSRNPEYARCIGSECAMWRWLTGGTGYCGMGGRP